MVLDPARPLPEVFDGYYLFMAEMTDAEGVKKRPTYETKPLGDVAVFGDYYRRMEQVLAKAVAALEEGASKVPETHRALFEAEVSPTRWFYHTIHTTANFYELAPLRDQLHACVEGTAGDTEVLKKAHARVAELLAMEQANTEAALPVIAGDMRLDFYYGSDHTLPHAADMMAEKLKILAQEQNEVLPALARKCGLQ